MDAQAGRILCEVEERYSSYAFTSQGTPSVSNKPPDSPSQLSEGTNPADI